MNTNDVSTGTAKALRDAMARLLNGAPKHTDGRLTKTNLGREAGVSHATLHRAKAFLAEWDAAVTAAGKRTPQQARYDHQTSSLRADLARKSSECAELRKRLDAAATVIATLHHENAALRSQLSRQGTVVPIAQSRRTGIEDHHGTG